jgi:hypothetical protein
VNEFFELPVVIIAELEHGQIILAELALSQAHDRQGIRETFVINLDPHLDLDQLGVLFRAVFGLFDFDNTQRELSSDLHVGRVIAGFAEGYIVVEL